MCNRKPQIDSTISENLAYDKGGISNHTKEYSSAIKKNEKMPFVATWIDPRNYTK